MFEYNPDHIIPAWGSTVFSAFGADSKVTGARLKDGTAMHVGADGQVTVTMNPDRSGMITVVLVQGSEVNTELLIVQQTQENTGRLQKRPFSITDLSGGPLINSPNAWIRKIPDHEYGMAEAKERVWIFDCDKLLFVPGASVF